MMGKDTSKNKALAINMISSAVAVGVHLAISFFLSPYIVAKLGVEANGFVTLASNFVGYASLISIALNSMAGRFITIKFYQDDLAEANKYYTAVTLGNYVLSLFMVIPAVLCVIYLENFINISADILWDVKLLFALVFLNYLVRTTFSSWNTATFVTNKLYIQSMRDMQSQLIRVAILLGLFFLIKPYVYYMGVASLMATIYSVAYSLYYKKKLMPQLKVRIASFNKNYFIELIGSGIWNTINQLGMLLLSGLDLLIANVFVGAEAMGILSLGKILPNVLIQLTTALKSVFTPTFIMKYAQGDIEGLKLELKKAMKITGIILTIPLSLVIIFGNEFYQLWVPSQDAVLLQTLSVLTIFGYIFTVSTTVLFDVFVVVNKLKTNAVLVVISGLASTGLVFILLGNTNLGLLAIAGVSSVANIIRNLCFTVPFGAKYLNLKWNTFFPEVGYSVLSVLILIAIGYGIENVVVIDSWLKLALYAALTGVLGLVINSFIVLNKTERNYLVKAVKSKVHL